MRFTYTYSYSAVSGTRRSSGSSSSFKKLRRRLEFAILEAIRAQHPLQFIDLFGPGAHAWG